MVIGKNTKTSAVIDTGNTALGSLYGLALYEQGMLNFFHVIWSDIVEITLLSVFLKKTPFALSALTSYVFIKTPYLRMNGNESSCTTRQSIPVIKTSMPEHTV